MTEHDNPLRRAAILIDSLDGRSADALLEQMGSEQAGRVRTAVLQLGVVDPAERHQVIEAFMHAGESAATPAEEAGVEMDQSLVEKLNSSAAQSECETEQKDTPEPEAAPSVFASLRDASIETLAACLSREHAQTIGVVLAHLPSRQSAQLLEFLPAQLQSDVLHRLAHLEETDEAVLDELEQQLLEEMSRFESTQQLRKKGHATLAGILDAADDRSRRAMLESLHSGDRWLARQFGHRPADPPAQSGSNSAPAPRTMSQHAKGSVEFNDLLTLDDANLARLLRAANPEVALLALTGASRQFVDRILNRMPPRQSRALRQRMAELGPIRLSDMERAQRQLADLAMRMADEGLIEIPSSRRFTIAA